MLLEAPPPWMPLVLGGVSAAGIGLHRGRTWGVLLLAAIAAGLAVHAAGLLEPVGVSWRMAGPAVLWQQSGPGEALVPWRAALFAASAALAGGLAAAPYAGPMVRWLRGRAR